MTNHPSERKSPDPLAQLSDAGVSVWLDDLSRELLVGGGLDTLITRHHVVGITSNPTIFASALAHGERYTDQLRRLNDSGAGTEDAVFAITTTDARTACQALRPIHEASSGLDGRVSIEVDPRLADDADATVSRRTRWWPP